MFFTSVFVIHHKNYEPRQSDRKGALLNNQIGLVNPHEARFAANLLSDVVAKKGKSPRVPAIAIRRYQ